MIKDPSGLIDNTTHLIINGLLYNTIYLIIDGLLYNTTYLIMVYYIILHT